MTVYYPCPECGADVDDDNEWIKTYPIKYCRNRTPFHEKCGLETHDDFCGFCNPQVALNNQNKWKVFDDTGKIRAQIDFSVPTNPAASNILVFEVPSKIASSFTTGSNFIVHSPTIYPAFNVRVLNHTAKTNKPSQTEITAELVSSIPKFRI